jgi:hypothetical protein
MSVVRLDAVCDGVSLSGHSVGGSLYLLVDRQYQKAAYKDSGKRIESLKTFINLLAIYSLE